MFQLYPFYTCPFNNVHSTFWGKETKTLFLSNKDKLLRNNNTTLENGKMEIQRNSRVRLYYLDLSHPLKKIIETPSYPMP